MSEKIFLFLTLTLCGISHSATANSAEPFVKTDPQTVEKFCENINPNLLKEYSLPGEPSFWIKPFEIGKKLYFTGILDSKAVIIEAETGKITSVEGNQDPLVSFDDKIFTSLTGKNGLYDLNFYSPVENNGIKLEPYKMQMKIYGAYQSIAPLKTEIGSTHYRVLIDKFDELEHTTAPSILDFEKTPDRQLKIKGEFRNPCAGQKLQTPFLSKDGTMFAALNLTTQTTQVFDISSGKCELKVDLGFITGKADFNYDGTQLVFHKVGFDVNDSSGYISSISSGNWSNIFVYDLNTKKFKQVTQNKTENSYYPVFLKDGSILHINSKPAKNGKYNFSVGVSKNPMTESSTAEAFVCTSCSSVQMGAKTAIGQLLFAICSDPPRKMIEPSSFILKLNNLNTKDCKDLVNRYWSKDVRDRLIIRNPIKYGEKVKLEDVLALKKEDLLAACP